MLCPTRSHAIYCRGLLQPGKVKKQCGSVICGTYFRRKYKRIMSPRCELEEEEVLFFRIGPICAGGVCAMFHFPSQSDSENNIFILPNDLRMPVLQIVMGRLFKDSMVWLSFSRLCLRFLEKRFAPYLAFFPACQSSESSGVSWIQLSANMP